MQLQVHVYVQGKGGSRREVEGREGKERVHITELTRARARCSKTTLLKCLAELVVYQAGEITLRGR